MDILNQEAISSISNAAFVVIWLVYLHLFLHDYRRRNRPYMIIHHAQGHDPGALCLFVNMSQEPIHVQCVIANVDGADGFIRHYVTDYRRITPDDRNVQSKLRQGPIQPGGYLTLGTFEDIILGRQSDPNDTTNSEETYASLRRVDSLQICLAVKHGPSKSTIGARRQFLVEHPADDVIIRALNIDTEQLVSSRRRKEVRGWMETGLEPKRTGSWETPQSKQTR